jgi:GcrA cell cycle regulator
MEWSEDMIARLRGLWDEGHSTAEIGRRMGVSKNAIIGKAHRLSLPGRPSPIRPDRPPGMPRRRSTPRRITGPTLPPLTAGPVAAEGKADLPRPREIGTTVSREADRAGAAFVGEMAARPRPLSVPRLGGRQLTCCWPIGEPGTPSFHFCDAPALPGKPYCDDHAQIAYVRVRERRDDAA